MEGHRLNWDEGQEGKGVIDQHGNVHTFDSEEYPYHEDYMSEHLPDDKSKAYFYINSDGGCHMGNFLDPGDYFRNAYEEHLKDADPRLHMVDKGWDF